MKPRNWTSGPCLVGRGEKVRRQNSKTDLENRILLFRFEFVGTKNLQPTLSLLGSETLIVTLKEGKDILDNNGL
jgi:hypothetical protein